MSEIPATVAAPRPGRSFVLRLAIVLALAVAGLGIVKWYPYFFKARLIAVTHSMGASAVFGKGFTVPSPSVAAALGYAGSYFNAVWQAWVLGVLLAAAIETLLPRNWLARVLGKTSMGTSFLAGVLALPGMM